MIRRNHWHALNLRGLASGGWLLLGDLKKDFVAALKGSQVGAHRLARPAWISLLQRL